MKPISALAIAIRTNLAMNTLLAALWALGGEWSKFRTDAGMFYCILIIWVLYEHEHGIWSRR